MGLSSSSSTTKTKPIYAPQIEAAGNAVSNTFNQTQPQTLDIANQYAAVTPGLLDQFTKGNPAINAEQNYITSTLGSDPAHNPQLDAILNQTNNDVANTTNAKLGLRGLTGGTVQQDILSRNLAQNDANIRYQDYNNQQQLRAQAAGLAPGAAAGQVVGIMPALATGEAATSLPLDAAVKYAAATGGLLGPYTNQKTTTSGGFGNILGGILGAGLGGWASGGFKV